MLHLFSYIVYKPQMYMETLIHAFLDSLKNAFYIEDAQYICIEVFH